MTTSVIPPDVIAAARASQAKWDVPASICLAQWALESGWGRFLPPGSNNPFGIKAAPGEPFVLAMTREVLDGRDVRLPQRFRVFATFAEAFDQHGRLLATAAPYAAARAVRRDARAFARALQGHYATDPNYAAELIAVMDDRDLYRFDLAPAVPVRRTTLRASSIRAAGLSRMVRSLRPRKGTRMLTNKWLQFGLSTLMTVLAGSASLDWSTIVSPTHAAGIATGIAAVKAVLNLLAPGPREPVQPTGSTFITHTAV